MKNADRKRLQDLSPAIVELLDKQAITELVYNYSRAVDRRDFGLLASLYTPDGIDDHGLYCGDAAGFVEWVRTALATVDMTTHHVHNLLIAIDGDIAEGEVYVTAYNRIPGDEGQWEDLLQGLRYLDHYRRTDERWQFSRRTVICDWVLHQSPSVGAEHPLLQGKRYGAPSDADLSYECLTQALFSRIPDNDR